MADAETIRREADEILARPEYAPRGRSVLERILDWIADRISGVLEWIADLLSIGGGPTTGSATPIGWVVLVLLVVLLGYFLTRVRLRRRARAEAPPDVRHAVDEDVRRADWLARAARAEAEGRWREAVRCRYRATVAGLIERRLLSAEPGATSGEHQRRLRAGADASSPRFDQVSDRFEHVWYGGEDADAETAAGLVAADEEILQAKR